MKETYFEIGRRIMREFIDYFDRNRTPNKDWTYTYKGDVMTVIEAKSRYNDYINILKIDAATLHSSHFV